MQRIDVISKKPISLFFKGRIVGIIVSVVSISLAHYAGFLSIIPLQIVAASGSDLAFGVTATFLFYISLSAIMARVIVGIFLPLVLPAIVIAGRIEHGIRLKSLSKKKKFVKSYNVLLESENLFVVASQLVIFTFILFGLYLEPKPTWSSVTLIIVVLILVILSGLFRAKFLLVFDINKYISMINKRPVEKVNAVSALFFTVVAAMVVFSYVIGLMRINTLISSQPQQITNRYFKGYANLLASSGSSALLYQKQNGNERYMYLTADYALAVESKPKSFPLLEW